MATVTGTLLDVGLESVQDRSPELVWTPSSTTTTIDGNLITALPITTIPAADGSWSVELVSTEVTAPPITYRLRINLRDPASGFTWVDFPDWAINVPVEGGALPDFTDVPVGGGIVWEVAGATIPALARPGDLMLNTLTSDLYRLS
jgi:hypothetical protein